MPEKQKMAQKKILVIDDDQFLLDIIKRKLVEAGFAVNSCLEAEKAFDILRNDHPDIILLDLILPGMDGFEFMRIKNNDPRLADIPVIVISNLGQQSDIDHAMELGAKDYIIKANYTPSEFINKINEVANKEKLKIPKP
ncbi:MAG: response regulator [Candidatus Niyogibacteria bacterium CG10_big_fil_rev_8_21_14_0_10_42_19]|uniref:Response regulator n=1 Tax=Candidatus Niyogibacteria bacterium CG10_big_fil_rev_8_21_14_0_10_42_19 TaxID=1974725 RepID=A0A2H0TGP4_9BACT|nr:MAG: response regulator [Candidatus Niyogibacteria bacterium CG10_big_fil_rev_8_21_14_0_10_42_19]